MSERIEISLRTSFEDKRRDSQHAMKPVLSSSSHKEESNELSPQYGVCDDDAPTDRKATGAAKAWPKRACHKSFRASKPSFPLHPSSLTTVSHPASTARTADTNKCADDESLACLI
jgi:hypothetical protein